MDKIFSAEQKERIESDITAKYRKVALSPEGNFRYPTGRAGLAGQNYDSEILRTLPEEVLNFYCGVGNPFSLGPIRRGEAVLDVGCGAGVDTLVAATLVGPEGRAVGIDLTPEMLKRAEANLGKTQLGNASFRQGSAEKLPFADGAFDVVISNGAVNLVPDKLRALREVFRVLKPGGRLMVADQILAGEEPGGVEPMLASWAG